MSAELQKKLEMNLQRLQEKKILVLGTIFMDIKGYPEPPFLPTGRNTGRIEYKYGGVARNVADDLAGLGIHPTFLSIAEPDGPGQMIVEDLRNAGVDVEYIVRSKEGIGTWMVILDAQGDVCANLSKRQSLLPLCDLLDQMGDALFQEQEAILLEMDAEEEVVSRVFALAERKKIPVYGVISNMTIGKERFSYIRKTRMFVCNRLEAGILFDENTGKMNSENMLDLLKNKIREFGISGMVVTLDKEGAVFASLDGQEGYCPACDVSVVDTTGAGDSFFAGVSAGLIYGMNLEESCKLGTQMAATVIGSRENVFRPVDES